MAYEYVPKNEYQPVREELEEIIQEVQDDLRANITFQFILVGSGKKKLITRLIGGNKGFDFDYNLSLQKTPDDYDARDIRESFFNAIQKSAKSRGYKTENSKTAITIKLIDKKNKKIIHGCDFGIVNDYEEDADTFQEIIIFDKNDNQYKWNKRPNGKNYNFKLQNIVSNNLWEELKEENLKLKNNNNDPDKKSFQLFLEAINNVYNRYDWVN